MPEPLRKNGSIGYCQNVNSGGDLEDSGSNCDLDKIFNHAIASSGLNESDYDNFLIFTSQMYSSTANRNRSHVTLVDNLSRLRRISIHEVMHLVGGLTVHSGGGWHCPGMPETLSIPISYVNNRPFAKVGANPDDPMFGCGNTLYDYLDFYSVLGAGDVNTYHIPAYLKMIKGFLRPEQTATVSYQNYPSHSTLTLEAVETRTSGLKQILVPIGRTNTSTLKGSVLSLEYRTLRGFNADPRSSWPPVQGVQIRLIPTQGSFSGSGNLSNAMETILMGTIPTNSGTTQPFHYGDIRIEVLQGDTESARVKISRY
ncbi:hypothetical protein AB3N59_04405 [Leptospira sp. WS92.C1]